MFVFQRLHQPKLELQTRALNSRDNHAYLEVQGAAEMQRVEKGGVEDSVSSMIGFFL